MLSLRPFQRDFLRGALAPGVTRAALCIPRANGKSFLAGHILTRGMTPGDSLHVPGAEYLLCSGSIEQSRYVFRFVRQALEELAPGKYRFIDSATRLGITHVASNTKLRVLSSNGKTGMGIVGCPLLVADEPGSWEVVGGQLLSDAIETAIGKPNSPMRVVYIGTLAPSRSGWWHDLIKGGSRGRTYVKVLQGDRKQWDKWPEIRRVNPLVGIDAGFRRTLLEERDQARADSRLKARFLSFRLNLPSADESETLLTPEDFELMTARPVPEREGQPLVGLDCGHSRAWSAAVAVWRNGRTEAMAVAPGVPCLEDQERRDRVPAGTYRRLEERGLLDVVEGLRAPGPEYLWNKARSTWGRLPYIVCDRFQLADLLDVVPATTTVEPRITRWSDATFDIRALRRGAVDGPLSIDPPSRLLVAVSLSAALVKNDDQGSVRIVDNGSNNTARDDVAAAFTLVAGAYARQPTTTGGVRLVQI